MHRAGKGNAESTPRTLRRAPGGLAAAVRAVVPSLSDPIHAPGSGGHQEVVKGVGGPQKIMRTRRRRRSQDGYTKREREFAGVAG